MAPFDEICKGCGRSVEEIRDWETYTDLEREETRHTRKNDNRNIFVRNDWQRYARRIRQRSKNKRIISGFI